nr:hypothetical protein GCM10020241_63540 [Streptoalloteichus tenebrarius]
MPVTLVRSVYWPTSIPATSVMELVGPVAASAAPAFGAGSTTASTAAAETPATVRPAARRVRFLCRPNTRLSLPRPSGAPRGGAGASERSRRGLVVGVTTTGDAVPPPGWTRSGARPDCRTAGLSDRRAVGLSLRDGRGGRADVPTWSVTTPSSTDE